MESHSNSYESWAATNAAESQASVVSWEGGGSNALMCSDCGFTGHDKAVLAEHRRVVHQFGTSDPWPEYQCQFCPSKFSHHDRLLCHLQRHTNTGSFDCFLCEKKFSREQVLPQATAPTTSQAIDGVADEVGVENGAEAFRCDICLFTCPCGSELAEHKRALHADPANRNWFKCHYCRVSFPHRDRLMVHLQKHTGTGFFDCFLCVRKFASEQNLLRHVRTVHGASENFPCHLCPRTFTRKDNLLAHIRKHRNGRC
nr:zinc finger protein 205-like [Dermacentor andersoni]